ncbi:SMP-30/gluconolactonase/LRE family protein [Planctomicrobium piriforme]|uniref:Sugar lactone lactonase YvrE n=1 Tax=Planctomicrobium piriforme TaxID=1576369 RepID=A0A1I3SQ91_9PLAN|nr:SMP-30/gluconolactonase/LRE family protein [Planctomicrobium piriforme]SFJ60875.1 Sugar lactone lactonase YvrE [Planctomicrobium piriforme]
MKRWMCQAVGLLLLLSSSTMWGQDVVLTEDSKPQPGVPEGQVLGPFQWKSKIFPGTVRNYWLYVPQQYNADKPACVFVVQDGVGLAKGWKLPTVLDNLIHKKEIPIQIGIFVEPGVLPAANEKAQPRFNRSFEYDSIGDRYAQFLIEEILPEVKQKYNLSDDPNDRAIAGSSSGAICAFNVAWERPDQFRRVVSTIGTYVGLRGADVFPTLIRKCEPKPIRVFLEDGTGDLNIYAGDWFTANLDMLSALKYSNYDVQNAWGDGGHNAKHGSQIMPDALRFIWHDYPQPVAKPAPQKARIDIVIEGEDWQEVSSGHKFTEGPAVNEQGEVFFSDVPNGKVHKIALDGKVTLFAENCPGINGLMFGPDGKLYGCENGSKQIVRFSPDGKKETVVDGVTCNDLVLLANGNGYFTDPTNKQVWFFTPAGEKKVVDTGIERPNGIIVSPDQTLLTVADSVGRMTYSFQIQPDGSLAAKQTYGWLHVPDDAVRSGADGMTVDTLGNLYVCTRMGIQVLDQPGRVNLILDRPQPGSVSNVVFGGPNLDTLYATAKDKVFKRKVKTKGLFPFKEPIMPPKPGL